MRQVLSKERLPYGFAWREVSAAPAMQIKNPGSLGTPALGTPAFHHMRHALSTFHHLAETAGNLAE
jgi:hypothetical protein